MTLQLYILRQIVTGLVFTVTGMIVIAVPGMAIGAIQRLGGAFIGPILGYLPLEFVGLVPYLIPLGFLLSVVWTYGRLAAENEWTAMCAAGFSPLRLLMPGVGVALALGGASMWLARDVAPPASEAKREYRNGAVLQVLQTLAPGRTQFKLRDFYLSAGYREGDDFRDVVLNIPAHKDQAAQQIWADRLRYRIDDEKITIDTWNPKIIQGGYDGRVGKLTLEIPLSAIVGETKHKVRWKALASDELAAALERGEVPEKDLAAARFELQDRDARVATCLMFLLLGAPTGLLLRRGSQLGALAAAVGYALVYLLLSLRFGRVLAENGVVPAWVGAWGATAIGMIVGLWMTWKVART